MRKEMKPVHVKRDYLIRLAIYWCRADTDVRYSTRFDRAAAAQALPRRRSRANSDSTRSRARTSIAWPRSISTSHGRGREL